MTLILYDFDIIIAGEIIEHLGCPGAFLRSTRFIMNTKTDLILTTPNVFSLKLFFHTSLRREKIHNDHNYYFYITP